MIIKGLGVKAKSVEGGKRGGAYAWSMVKEEESAEQPEE